MSSVDELYTEQEVAERLGFTRQWLRGKRLGGKGPKHIFLGNRVMYDMADVNAWIESLKTEKPHE
jgi:predicted DNA-binding transcriptional regulator AlpA